MSHFHWHTSYSAWLEKQLIMHLTKVNKSVCSAPQAHSHKVPIPLKAIELEPKIFRGKCKSFAVRCIHCASVHSQSSGIKINLIRRMLYCDCQDFSRGAQHRHQAKTAITLLATVFQLPKWKSPPQWAALTPWPNMLVWISFFIKADTRIDPKFIWLNEGITRKACIFYWRMQLCKLTSYYLQPSYF